MSWSNPRYKRVPQEYARPSAISDLKEEFRYLEVDDSVPYGLKLQPKVGFNFYNNISLACCSSELTILCYNASSVILFCIDNETGEALAESTLSHKGHISHLLFLGKKETQEKEISFNFIAFCGLFLINVIFFPRSKVLMRRVLRTYSPRNISVSLIRISDSFLGRLCLKDGNEELDLIRIIYKQSSETSYCSFQIKSRTSSEYVLDLEYWKNGKTIVFIYSSPAKNISELRFFPMSSVEEITNFSTSKIVSEIREFSNRHFNFSEYNNGECLSKMKIDYIHPQIFRKAGGDKNGKFRVVNDKNLALIVRPVFVEVIDLLRRRVCFKIDSLTDTISVLSNKYILMSSVACGFENQETSIYDISLKKSVASFRFASLLCCCCGVEDDEDDDDLDRTTNTNGSYLDHPKNTRKNLRLFGMRFQAYPYSKLVIWREGSDNEGVDPLEMERIQFLKDDMMRIMDGEEEELSSIHLFSVSFGGIRDTFHIPRLLLFFFTTK